VTAGGAPRRRRRSAAAGLSLIFAFALVVASLAGSAGATNTACAWQRHAKRVVTHVKRHGKVTKVVRIKHFWTCNPVAEAIAPPVQAPAPTPTPAPTPAPPVAEPEANAVGVIADDHGGVLSYIRTEETAKAGGVTIDFTDRGEDEHNLTLVAENSEGNPEGETLGKIGDLKSEEHESQTYDLPPGHYLMYCSIGHHAEHGMKATLIVE
jgi:plastocyanin